jgi:hypothetical protein
MWMHVGLLTRLWFGDFPPVIQGVTFLYEMSVQFALPTEPAMFIFGTRKSHIIPEILSIVVIQCHITLPVDTVLSVRRNGQQVHEPTVVNY